MTYEIIYNVGAILTAWEKRALIRGFMFTGLIDHCGNIRAIEVLPDYRVFLVDTQFSDLQLGESISIDGVCVTVAEKNPICFLVIYHQKH